MTPEAAAFLGKSRAFLEKARAMRETWPDEAGRAAYMAGFHAAQALLFDGRGRVPKTHGGVQSEFAALVKENPAFGVDQRRFLGRAYAWKANADYGTDPDMQIAPEQLSAGIETAREFVAIIERLLLLAE